MLSKLTDNQSKNAINTEQLYSIYREAQIKSIFYRGGMTWKTINGAYYLYRLLDRKGNAKSLGPRSEKTEAIHKAFIDGREEIQQRLASLKDKLDEQARMNKALRIARCPTIVANIARTIDLSGLMGKGIEIIGTNAMYAYEAMAGVFFLQESLETNDVDLLFDSRSKIALAPEENITDDGILGLLRKADPSFQIVESSNFRASNKDGFLVDLIRQTSNPPWKNTPSGLGKNDLVATDIWNMKWMLSMPKVTQTVIAQDGQPFRMTVPDPRAFALFKYWLSESDERNPKKKSRDRNQAIAVREILTNLLPQYPLNSDQMRAFPADTVTKFLLDGAPHSNVDPKPA